MNLEYIPFLKLNEDAFVPTRRSITDAGIDLYALENTFIPHGTTKIVSTGVAIKVPEGFVGQICDRSSMGAKGLAVGAGIIDAGYAGEINIVLHNVTFNKDNDFKYTPGYLVKKGDKIAQMLLFAVATPSPVEVYDIWKSDRGNKGFGSSGT
jgi:dUTP pyrophosphatase